VTSKIPKAIARLKAAQSAYDAAGAAGETDNVTSRLLDAENDATGKLARQ
jgi:hypothetical protein